MVSIMSAASRYSLALYRSAFADIIRLSHSLWVLETIDMFCCSSGERIMSLTNMRSMHVPHSSADFSTNF